MDEKTIRLHLEEVRSALKRSEEEHEVLLSLLKGYEGWLRLHGVPQNGQNKPPQLSLQVQGQDLNDKGSGWRPTIEGILKDARGEVLHSKEIWLRAQARGLRSNAKNPVGAVDLTARGIAGVVKAGPRKWRWVGLDTVAPPLPDSPSKGG